MTSENNAIILTIKVQLNLNINLIAKQVESSHLISFEIRIFV